MSYEKLKQQILTISSFSEDEINFILSKFSSKSYQAKEFIVSENKVCHNIYFICNGLVRNFYYKEEKEITTYLATDNEFISIYSSFITQQKSIELMQCIEHTEVLSISFEDMNELYQQIPHWQFIGRTIAEKNYLCIIDRIFKFQSISATERYLDFLTTSAPKIVQRTPLIYIASFLGIAPESLSRIRKSIS